MKGHLARACEAAMRAEADRCAAEAMQIEPPMPTHVFALRLALAIILIGIGIAAVLSRLIQ